MSIEALWTVNFAAPSGAGNGIVVFESGKLYGGDAQYYWTGTYTVNNGKIIATLDVRNYGGMPYSVFGQLKNFQLEIDANVPGTIAPGTVMQASGRLVNQPAQGMTLYLTYRAALP